MQMADDTVGNPVDTEQPTETPAEVPTEVPAEAETNTPPTRGGDRQIDIEVEGAGQRRKLIMSLTWPSLMENLLTSFMSIADMIMVGELGPTAIAGIGLASQPRFIMLAAFQAMSIGTTALVARFKGARDPDSANEALDQSLIITFFLTATICSIMLFFDEALVRWVGGSELSEETIQAAMTYFRIQIYGFPTMSFTFVINAALRGAGNTRATFQNNSVMSVVNVFMNFCLISGRLGFPRLEVAGASLATVIGQTCCLAMAFYVLTSGKQYITLRIRKRWHINPGMISRIVNIGLPALAEQVIMRTGQLWFTTIVTSLGDMAYTAHMITMNILTLSFTTGMSFGISATTLVGQSLGRKRLDLAKTYVRMTQNIGYIVSTAIAVLLIIFGRPLAHMYTDNLTIIDLASSMLRIVAISNPIANARFVYGSALRGAGDTKYSAVVTFCGVLLLRPLLSLLFINYFHLGLTGVWIALTFDSVFCFILLFIRYRGDKWAQLQV